MKKQAKPQRGSLHPALRIRAGIPLFLVLIALDVLTGGCKTDDRQVQIAKHAGEFIQFPDLPRDIVYGPYCLNVTETSAVLAWEEKSRTKEPRHVEVIKTDLSPATEYIYRINGASQDGRMVTAPADYRPFSFLVVGDTQMNFAVSSQIAASMIATDPSASFFLHLGDIVDNSTRAGAWQEEWWEPMAGLLLYMPVYPVKGNHDAESPHYRRYFNSLRDSGKNYSFDWGRIHFVALYFNDSMHIFDENILWLIRDLQNHADADFIVICHHYPVYFSLLDTAPLLTNMQKILVPIYERYGVDLVLSGHVHGYQHHAKNGIQYVLSGGGGGILDTPGEPLDGITMCQVKTYNFLRCNVYGAILKVTAYDFERNIFDSFTIAKNH